MALCTMKLIFVLMINFFSLVVVSADHKKPAETTSERQSHDQKDLCNELAELIKARDHEAVFARCLRYKTFYKNQCHLLFGDTFLHVFAKTLWLPRFFQSDEELSPMLNTYATLIYQCQIPREQANDKKQTPLMLAALLGNYQVVHRLLTDSSLSRIRVEHEPKDMHGFSVRDYADASGYPLISRIIREQLPDRRGSTKHSIDAPLPDLEILINERDTLLHSSSPSMLYRDSTLTASDLLGKQSQQSKDYEFQEVELSNLNSAIADSGPHFGILSMNDPLSDDDLIDLFETKDELEIRKNDVAPFRCNGQHSSRIEEPLMFRFPTWLENILRFLRPQDNSHSDTQIN